MTVDVKGSNDGHFGFAVEQIHNEFRTASIDTKLKH